MNATLLIVIVLLGFIIIACIRTIRRATTVPSGHRGTATCGKCGYEIADLSFDRCPECGGKLLEVGIVTPQLTVRRGTSVFGLIATWTALIALIAIISFAVAAILWSNGESNLPRNANLNLQKSSHYIPAQPFRNTDMYEASVSIDVITNRNAKVRSGVIDVTITGEGQPPVSMKLDALTLQILDINGTSTTELDNRLTLAAVTGLYKSAGLDTSTGPILFEAKHFHEIIEEVATNPFDSPASSVALGSTTNQGLRHGGGTETGSPAPPDPFLIGLTPIQLLFFIGVGFWLIIYILGMRRMLLGRKRALAESE